jgi:hypothetical protein
MRPTSLQVRRKLLKPQSTRHPTLFIFIILSLASLTRRTTISSELPFALQIMPSAAQYDHSPKIPGKSD